MGPLVLGNSHVFLANVSWLAYRIPYRPNDPAEGLWSIYQIGVLVGYGILMAPVL